MAAKLGSDGAYFRLGTQPAKVFLGDAVVQTVPGAPVVEDAAEGGDISFAPPADGGSPILGYNIYLNGLLEESNQPMVNEGELDTPLAGGIGDDIEIAAVNAIGEGPKSNTVQIT
jgi:hypothetical protein